VLSTQLWWYTARSSGIVAWAMLSASVLWGLGLSTKALGRKVRPNWMLDLHRFLGGASVVFVGIHVVSLLLDSWVHFGLTEVLVPFTSSYRPGAVAWGVVGLYLLAAVEVTSLLRKRLSKRTWRAVHFASFPLFATATLHGLKAGTDGHTPVFQFAVVVVAVVVGGLTALRIAQATSVGHPSPTQA
jgi:predicted ferric reductase